jgi:hypothetical protein
MAEKEFKKKQIKKPLAVRIFNYLCYAVWFIGDGDIIDGKTKK